MKIVSIMQVKGDQFFKNKLEILKEIEKHHSNIEFVVPSYNLEENFYISSIISVFETAELIIADLSHERPSCYYELGIAECLNRPIHLIAQIGTEIHQTSLRNDVNYYENLSNYKSQIAILIRNLDKNG